MVTDVGKEFKRLGVGDEACTRLPEANRGDTGACAGDVMTDGFYFSSSLVNMRVGRVRQVPRSNMLLASRRTRPGPTPRPCRLADVTALQVLRKYRGSLEGKTVFIPAGSGFPTTTPSACA